MELTGSTFLFVNHSSCAFCHARMPDRKMHQGRHDFTRGMKFCDAKCEDRKIAKIIDEVS